ncbi:MAG TPA: Bax inhibitor-1 family protein [Gemmataceae bacterium]|nr:Bax inhibitor-1 family protein [Gemmataceae bacterium]
MSYGYEYPVVARAASSDRAVFIRRTYAHLAGAILAFMGIEALLLNVVGGDQVLGLLGASRWSWMIVLVAFMAAGWLARMWAHSESSPALQYLGLALYVVAEAVIFLPLLYLATKLTDPKVIPTAGIMTLAVFGGLTLAVFVTKKDYSFLGPILSIGVMIAFGIILAACLFGFSLGMLFSFAMVALASGYILYDTSNVMLHYRTDQHVGAALELFASVALLFWYILRIVMATSSRD